MSSDRPPGRGGWVKLEELCTVPVRDPEEVMRHVHWHGCRAFDGEFHAGNLQLIDASTEQQAAEAVDRCIAAADRELRWRCYLIDEVLDTLLTVLAEDREIRPVLEHRHAHPSWR